MNISLYGAKADSLRPIIAKHESLRVVDDKPDAVVCFGGDGTLLSAEMRWPNVPKVPLRNSRRGIRCISEPPEEVLALLAAGKLPRHEMLKLECGVRRDETPIGENLLAINEFSVHMGRSNAAVRFRIWLDGEPFGEASDKEVIGDGFVISTPFGSTAYFNQITRGTFRSGIGIAFKYTTQHTNHIIVPETTVIEAEVTRGPAILAHDNASTYIDLTKGDRLTIRRHEHPAILYGVD